MLTELLTKLAHTLRLPESWYSLFILLCNAVIAVVAVWLCFIAVRAWLRPVLHRVLDTLDGRLTHETERERLTLASHLAHLIPALLLQALAPALFSEFAQFYAILNVLLWVYLYLFIGLAIAAAISLIARSYAYLAPNPTIPYQGISQLLKLLTFIVFSILIISTVLDKSPALLLSGLGALTAVLLLVFKDAILVLSPVFRLP